MSERPGLSINPSTQDGVPWYMKVLRTLARSRALWLGLLALAFALYGQKLVWVDREVVLSIRWYAVGIALALLGWHGTYRNKRMLAAPLPTRRGDVSALQDVGLRKTLRCALWPRYVLLLAGFTIAISGATLLRGDYYSALGGWGWLAGLCLMALAFVGEPRKPVVSLDAATVEVEDSTDPRPGRVKEAIIFAAILALALVFRLYRLDDWTGGMHGDEGEAGIEALNIVAGNTVSPFTTGWFGQSNFYYWGVAAGIKLFGASLFGARIFAVAMGTLMLPLFYGLTRLWFGVRTAVIASILLSVSDVTVQFTRMEASNITTPLSLVAGFYFLTIGLRTRRLLPFVLSGFGFMFGLYFYSGARLTPFLIGTVLGYLFLLVPALRVLGNYLAGRGAAPYAGRWSTLRSAARREFAPGVQYLPHITAFLLACAAFAAPFWVYYSEHAEEQSARASEKLIFNNPGLMQSLYAESHAVSDVPLYLGLRWPTQDDIFPVVPLFFEKTPVSIELAEDGFWPRVLWAQTTRTLSILTYRFDSSSFYTFPLEPVAKPIEAVLIILGLAWALWRWRDARMGLLSLWFWSTIFAGGVLTIDAPYMARIIGIVPVMAICAALPLSKLAAETVALFGRLAAPELRTPMMRWGQAIALSMVFAPVSFLVVQNFSDYFLRYLAAYPYPEVMGQATFVRDMNRKAEAEGKPAPYYFDVGAHSIYWGHGTNRFLNHSADGQDMVNAANDMPLVDVGNGDVYFMVWPGNTHYLNVLETYYPEGESTPYSYGPPGNGRVLFTSFHVTAEQVQARRATIATYRSSTGEAVEREEAGFGTVASTTLPHDLNYPAQAVWSSNIVAPAYGRYRFTLRSYAPATLNIDGMDVISVTGTQTITEQVEVELLLARGAHFVRLEGTLQSPASQVALDWASGVSEPVAIAREYLWLGKGRGFTGVISSYRPELQMPIESGASGANTAKVTALRVDGFLGFRDAAAVANGQPFSGTWTGTLEATQTGEYAFDIYSNGSSMLLIDGNIVVDNQDSTGDGAPRAAAGTTRLEKGDHSLELRYNWKSGFSYLELFWQPPDEERSILTWRDVSASGGVATVPPTPSQPEGQSTPESISRGIGSDQLMNPRGVAVDAAGNIYVGDRGHHRVIVFSPDGKQTRTFGDAPSGDGTPRPGQLGDILDVAVGPDGTVYVADGSNDRVSVFTPDGEFKRAIGPETLGVQTLNGISVTSEGTLLAADPRGKQIVALPVADGQEGEARVVSLTDGANRLEQPVDVAAGVGGDVYTADLSQRIVKLNAGGKIVAQWPVPVGTSEGGSRLAVSPDGSTVYMSDPDRARIDVLDVATGEISYLGGVDAQGGNMRAPSGIAVGKDGLLYVVDRETNIVQVIRPRQ